MNILTAYFNQIIEMLFLALAAFLGVQVKNLVKKYINTKIKRDVCRAAVRFVEQVYKDLHGHDKLVEAMDAAATLLAKNGITISKEELVTMLEAAVNEFNDSFHKTDPDVKAKDEYEKTFGAVDMTLGITH